ncbi:MAG: restriction endonuclease subunit S [Prevotellaceae bacterium]|nr:restriction endonuclease subunit S [Prevotellaceae bacterium]
METIETRIGQCIDCNPKVKLLKGETYPVIDIDKITIGRKIVFSDEYILFDGKSGAKFENGDTLMARITPCLENGKMAMARIEGKGLGSTELFVFRGIEGITDSDFVYYLLKQQHIRNLAANSMSGASGRQRADLDFIKKIKITLPSLPFQRRIASILSSYDSIIECNSKRIRLLEQMAENLYKEWFVRFRFPGHNNVKMKDGLPEGWKNERLGNVANISTGKCNREDAEEKGEYPLFDRSQEIKRSSVWLKDCEAIIIPGEGTSFIPRYYVGKFNLHQRCYCVNPKSKGIGKYLFYMLMLNRMYFLSVATGATVPSLRYNNFASMKFIMPDDKTCKNFDSIITTIFRQIDTLQHQNLLLSRQRDLLLPRLMSGKLEV